MISFGTLFIFLLIIAACFGAIILLLVVGMRFFASIFSRVFGFLFGVLGDLLTMVMCVIGLFIAAPLAVFFLVLGRWGSANAQARAFGDRIARIGHLIGSVLLVRPLRLVYLDSPANAVKEALPGYLPDGPGMLATRIPRTKKVPAAEIPSARDVSDPDHFEGYELVDELRAGGSGARLFVARPSVDRRARLDGEPELVVIKAFAIEQGSSLPSIVRESRALDGARKMGLVLEHHLDDERFWYVMPYHAGEQLGTVVAGLHAGSGPEGLRGEDLVQCMSHVRDLLMTLSRFHGAGLWHKDVKPDNLIVHDGSAHLVDLGLVTSLQSSLTLTTHGTEYFRDPELVRMALRGVKVHEVDGAKFDIYGSGAVLYFVLENDFPAHGGLSDFTRKVPDALRWIVRRSMADYDKRYDSTAAMLEDLDTVFSAEDPWSVVPAELPSMKAGGEPPVAPPPPFVRSHKARTVRAAGAPMPRSPRKPVPPRPGKSRKPVPTDRPTGLLLLIGAITVTAIFASIIGAVQGYGIERGKYARQQTSRILGPVVNTVTLSSLHEDRRILLIRDETAHLESDSLRTAIDDVVAWYVASGYEVDERPDFDVLAELAVESSQTELTSTPDPGVGVVLETHGYTDLCRVMADSDGDGLPEMRILSSNGNLSIIPVNVQGDEMVPVPTDAARRPAHAPSDAVEAALVSCMPGQSSEQLAWDRTNTPEHDSRRSWRKAWSRHPAPSTRSLHVRSRMPVSRPPTSPVAHARMSRATPTSV